MEVMHKSVLITGATSGIGFAAARLLVDRGALVIGIGRDGERCSRAQRAISGAGSGQVEFFSADLSRMAEVRRAAAEVKKLLRRSGRAGLDVLINNAAAVPGRRMETAEGIELQLALNHLAPFLLTRELLPLLEATGEGRVISVSSRSHRWGRIHWRDPQFIRGYHPLRAYAQSKLANLLFTYELRRRLENRPGLTALAFDPGLVRTEIGDKHTQGLASLAWRIRRLGGKPAEEAAAHLVELVAAPLRQLNGGGYWRGGKAVQPSGRAREEESAGRLWLLSERLAGSG